MPRVKRKQALRKAASKCIRSQDTQVGQSWAGCRAAGRVAAAGGEGGLRPEKLLLRPGRGGRRTLPSG